MMREIRCVFKVTRLVHATAVSSSTVRYYLDRPTVNFDILHDFLKIFWGNRNNASVIDLSVYVNNEPISKKAEMRLKGMIDSTLEQCDGSIPLTQLQFSILIDKVKTIKEAARRTGPSAGEIS